MREYKSTRNDEKTVQAKQAILQGLSQEGGLFVADWIEDYKLSLDTMKDLSYLQVAKKVFQILLPDFSEQEIEHCIEEAYGSSFDCDEITPLMSKDDLHVLELFHGPTQAFKDIGLQMLPQLMKCSLTEDEKDICILTATSGDTGKAALCGFQDVDRMSIQVFYPHEKVSEMQYLQMATQPGNNVHVCAIKGNFDDAQSAVKSIFEQRKDSDPVHFSSANSINIGRLIPQVVYYVFSYLQMVKQEQIQMGDKINFCVPTGNFGNVLAGYYAKKLGVPVAKLIVAANENNVLYDFFKDGMYNRNRMFHETISPSMDILVSSNLERLLYSECGKNSKQVEQWMKDLKVNGNYQIDAACFMHLKEQFYAGYATQQETKDAIASCFETYGYVLDPHTAVGYHVMKQYESPYKTVLLATASPYKFPQAVLEALHQEVHENVFDNLKQLEKVSGVCIPEALRSLQEKEILHHDVIEKEAIASYVYEKVKEG